MQAKKRETLTQEELVTELHQLGYPDASATRVAAWRKLDLLPPFSSGGHGQGRGAGRDESYWSNPTEALNQAVAIMGLLKSYRRLEELYLPLWQMGFEIPLERVRLALIEPLLATAKDFDVQEDGRNAIEDLIDQGVTDISKVMQRANPLFDVPDETVAAVLNVCANADYDFGDEPYEDGVSKLKEWERSLPQRCEKLLGESFAINPEVVADGNNIFGNAPFINQYLSLPHLLAATEDCTDEELMVVHRDLQLGREILLVFKRIVELLSPFLPEAFRFSSDDMVVVFNFGRLAIWADLALRRQGFGPLLDHVLPEILKALREDLNEAAAQEIAAAGPEIGKALLAFEQLIVGEMAQNFK